MIVTVELMKCRLKAQRCNRNKDVPLACGFCCLLFFQAVRHPDLYCGICANSERCAPNLLGTGGGGWPCVAAVAVFQPYLVEFEVSPLFFFSFSPVQWRQSSQVALSGSRSEGGGCHGSKGACSLSVCDATHPHLQTHNGKCVLEVFLTAGL